VTALAAAIRGGTGGFHPGGVRRAAAGFPERGRVLAQAAGLALLAALSPAVLLVSAAYLGSADPRRTSLFFFAGALTMSAILAVVVVVALRLSGLNHPRQHAPRDGLRLGLGLLLLVIAVVIAARRNRAGPGQSRRPGLVSRLIASPTPRSAFAVGMLLFAPGVTFIAALQVIATARSGIQLTALAVVIVVLIDVLLVWVPLLIYLAAPGPTVRGLTAFNGWLRAHSGALLMGVLIVAGVLLVASGSYGLASGT
jgi:hypothetical protein